MSLYAIASPDAREPGPLVTFVLKRTVAKVLSIGLLEFYKYPAEHWIHLRTTRVDGVGVMSIGRSRSLPLWNTDPARTNATRCGALTARYFAP